MKTMTIPALFDAHVHFRQTDDELRQYVPQTSRCCSTALVMPNLDPPLTTPERIAEYREAILRHAQTDDFDPLMTAYMTEYMAYADLYRIFADPHVVGVKVYSRGATTRSAHGIRVDWLKHPQTIPYPLRNAFMAVGACDRSLHLHLEDTDAYCLEREAAMGVDFIKWYYDVVKDPNVRVVFEHVSDLRTLLELAALRAWGMNVACTITLHHLLMTTDHVLGRNDNLCAPVAKTPADRQALLMHALLAPPWVMLGSDSAPHPRAKKYCAHAACGCYTAPLLVECLAELFDGMSVFSFPESVETRLARFTSGNASAYYGRPLSQRVCRLRQQRYALLVGAEDTVPWRTSADWYLENPFRG